MSRTSGGAGGGGGGPDTPWTVDHNANDFSLSNLKTLQVNGLDLLTGPSTTLISASPRYTLNAAGGVSGLIMNPVVTAADGTAASLSGLVFKPTATQNLTGTFSSVLAMQAQVGVNAPITTMKGTECILAYNGAVTVTTATLFRGAILNRGLFGGTLTTCIGLDLNSLDGTTVWGIQVGNFQSYHQGPMTIGAAAAPAASAILDLNSTTGALLVPRMTTVQKNALAAADGMIVYDTTLAQFAKRQAGAWATF